LADAGTTAITILPGFYTNLAKSASARFPFGFWFADANTLYVADEGDGKAADAGKDTKSGLQKWILVNGTWQLAYTLQKGLNLGIQYSVATGPNGEVYPTALNPATDGLRNIVGQVKGSGLVTIYGVTSTVSSSGDQGADPNQLVAITDTLSFTNASQAASEQFVILKSAGYGEVLRGVAFAPGFTFAGVAAGDPTSDGATLWTLVSEPQGASVPLTLQIATDAGFGSIVQSYSGNTDPGKDNVLKTNATGLQPGTRYYYRFVGPAPLSLMSGTGTFKTAPDAGTAAAVRFAFSGDADGLMRPYPLAHDFDQLGLDFFVWLGDTIYETASSGSPAVALSGTIPPPSSAGATQAQLNTDYSRKYREQLLPVNHEGQNGLQTFFAAQANYTLYDNHELGNRQYINGGAAPGGPVGDMSSGAGVDARVPANDINVTGSFMNKATGFEILQQVYLNHQPVHEHGFLNVPADPRTDGTPQLFLAQQWGRNAIFINLDDRSYRDIRMKTAANADDTGARADQLRIMLGATQLAWLKQALVAAQTAGIPWKFIALSSPIDQLGPIGGALNGTLTSVNSDGGKSWMGGYRAERNDLLKFIADNKILNVVFLSTDDHQNRVNELLYSPTGDTGDQASYMRVPRCFSIVDGPLGATGPDLITDHTFTNVKAIADSLAEAQTAAGLDPVGLDPLYPGLHSVTREGDPFADSLRQPIDFYSPDTFNYTILEIGADCPTLTVTTYGINSYQVNTFPEISAAGPVRQILSFQVDGDIEPPVIQSVSATPNVLWPPNHALIPVVVSVAATDNYAIASQKIVSVTSNEPQNGTGDGDTSPDWVISGDLSLQLRAERVAGGSGRTYTITVEVTDTCGNKSQQTTTVLVPKSQGH
jgi:phosphodiesterase/alkaline phosphatase D-like protein